MGADLNCKEVRISRKISRKLLICTYMYIGAAVLSRQIAYLLPQSPNLSHYLKAKNNSTVLINPPKLVRRVLSRDLTIVGPMLLTLSRNP